jgi:hypothetical protein
MLLKLPRLLLQAGSRRKDSGKLSTQRPLVLQAQQ